MSPRERALAAMARIEAAREEIHSELEIWEEVIADAENDALERAAQRARAFAVEPGDDGEVIADEILELRLGWKP